MQQTEADKRGVLVEIEIADDGSTVRADRRALRRILVSVLDNAIKFSPTHGTGV